MDRYSVRQVNERKEAQSKMGQTDRQIENKSGGGKRKKGKKKENPPLSAHPTWTSRGRDIRSHGHSFEPSITLGNGLPESDPLSARSHRVTRVLDVGPGDIRPRVGEQDRPDPEVTVRTVGALFCLDDFLAEGVEFGRGQAVFCA